jgi:hypothetical protein
MYRMLPKVLVYAATIGLLGKGIKRIMDGASAYDLANYFIIPLVLASGGKSVYLRTPQDELGRFFDGLAWKALQVDEAKEFQSLMDYKAGEVPSMSPPINLGSKLVSYLTKQGGLDMQAYMRARSNAEKHAIL